MDPKPGPATALNSEQLVQLHNLTKDVAKLCYGQLRNYVDALAPLFRPRRVLGEHIEGSGRESVVAADQNLAELKELFFRVCGGPFDLRRELPTPLESVPAQIQLYEWEYTHEVPAERGKRTITILAPLTWVLAYPSTYSLSMMRQVVAGKQERDQDIVRSFVLRACLMHLLFAKNPALGALFAGLRYQVEVRKSPQLGDLPFVTVSAPVATGRPSDDLLLMATGLSGRTAFQEVIDREKGWRIPDQLQAQISSILRNHEEPTR